MPKSATFNCEASEPVNIQAAAEDAEKKSPATFDIIAYTGKAVKVASLDLPVVVDLESLKVGRNLVANLDHNREKRVGNVTNYDNDGAKLRMSGIFSAATDARREVIESAKDGFQWEASIEVSSPSVELVRPKQQVTVNGQTFDGPLYVARKSLLQGFGFVSHGADDSTTVNIAASAGETTSPESKVMNEEFKLWATELGIDIDAMDPEKLSKLQKDFEGMTSKEQKKPTAMNFESEFEKKLAEHERQRAIQELGLAACDKHPFMIDAIRQLTETAVEAKWTIDRYRLELMAGPTQGTSIGCHGPASRGVTEQVLEAAICQHARLPNIEKHFDERTLDMAWKRYHGRIGLNEFILDCAKSRGYNATSASRVTIEAQRAAFGMVGPVAQINAAFSTLEISNIIANTANKFLMQGWMQVDMTPMRIAKVTPVNNFHTRTTVSLIGDTSFEEVGKDGQIAHGQLGDLTYTNKAGTYAKMLAITRQDMINDDLGALTAAPRRLGRGGAIKLNEIFWTEFLDNSSFFTSGNANVSTDTGALGLLGLEQAETIFMAQTDPDGNPLMLEPQILLVPTALKTTAMQLMGSERIIDGTATGAQGDRNVWNSRFRVESSPYMQNSNYTGYSAVAWYLLGSPEDLAAIEIVALNGRVEPVVESADAEFNVLGIQMRAYSDVGVNLQEYRAGVRADGSAAD